MSFVRDSMSAPAISVRTDTSAIDVMRIFERGTLSAVPVLDADGRLAGVLSTTDMVRQMAAHLDCAVPAGDLMSAPAVIATPGEELDVAAWRLVAAGAHRLVVIDDDRPVGVLSIQDILGSMLHQHLSTPLRAIAKHPIETILLGETIATAIERLAGANVHGLVVLDGLAPVGIFGHAEAIAANRFPPSLLQDPVEEVMCNELLSLDADTAIDRAARYAWSVRARRILVTEGSDLVGIVGDLDPVDAFTRQ
jgi:CBS domain-containing protein